MMMISAVHLVWIVPLSVTAGLLVAAIFKANGGE